MDTFNPYEPPLGRLAPSAPGEPDQAMPDRRRSWVIWFLALNLCWLLLLDVGTRHQRHNSIGLNDLPWPDGSIRWDDSSVPWPIRAVYVLMATHLAISGAAFLATFWITRRWGRRLVAWLVLAVMLGWTFLCAVGAGMATTGVYL